MQRLRIRHDRPLDRQLRPAAAAIAAGQIVAFPTDTLYGLAVNPRSAAALDQLFAVKGRSQSRTMPLVAADLAQVALVARLTPQAEVLARAFWPGPLTLVLPALPGLAVGAVEHGRVAVRIPDHPVAQALARVVGHPVTATSANRSGAPGTYDPSAVVAEVPSVELLIDDGPAPGGPASTIVDLGGEVPLLRREGAVAWSRVLESLGSAPDPP